jgi:hypothetical protein
MKEGKGRKHADKSHFNLTLIPHFLMEAIALIRTGKWKE